MRHTSAVLWLSLTTDVFVLSFASLCFDQFCYLLILVIVFLLRPSPSALSLFAVLCRLCHDVLSSLCSAVFSPSLSSLPYYVIPLLLSHCLPFSVFFAMKSSALLSSALLCHFCHNISSSFCCHCLPFSVSFAILCHRPSALSLSALLRLHCHNLSSSLCSVIVYSALSSLPCRPSALSLPALLCLLCHNMSSSFCSVIFCPALFSLQCHPPPPPP